MGRLEGAYGHHQQFFNLKALLAQIGQHCRRYRSGGVFRLDDLRHLKLAANLNTVVTVHLPLLIACGALEACGEKMVQYAEYSEHTLSLRQLEQKRLAARSRQRR